MPREQGENFGKRRLQPLPPASPSVKRSGHVALLLMGTVAIGGGAYALMPSENCDPNRPGALSASSPGQTTACSQGRSSSSGGGHGYSGGSSSRSSFYSSDSSSGHSAGGSSPDSGASQVTRGGFGSFAHAFTSHFSGGG